MMGRLYSPWTRCGYQLTVLLAAVLVTGGQFSSDEGPQESVFDRITALRKAVHVDIPPTLLDHDAEVAASAVLDTLVQSSSLQQRLVQLFQKTKTTECRAEIAEHLGYFVSAIGKEESLPFSDIKFQNECGEEVYMWNDLPQDMHPGDIQNRTYQPPHNESEYLPDAADLKLCYGILTHDNAAATIRLIEALYEPGHVFIIHVDGKYEATQETLQSYSASREHVHVLRENRVRVNWGGFTMVNATLQLLRYAFALDDEGLREPLDFHKFVHLASSSYPLASNGEIRSKLSSFPLDANFLNIIMQPTRPSNYVWHYFVECDDALHRIFQLPGLQTATAGAELYTSSQWFIISREFAHYLADPQPGTFVHDFITYAKHMVVADESFFGTILRNTAFCKKHHNRNFLHLQFDRWESELPAGKRDERKCPMPNPDHCGRSPTIMSVDYADILELSDELFARKFDDKVDSDVKDIVDSWRAKRDEEIRTGWVKTGDIVQPKSIDFEGYGVLIVAKETVNDTMPLCLGLGESGNAILLTDCFHDWVPRTLGEGWETGGVILKETPLHVRWEVGPCTSDGLAERNETGMMEVTKGNYSVTGPRCMLKQMDGIRNGRCYDGHPGSLQPGGPMQVYPCVHQWYQFVSFGDGEHAPIGSIFSTIPSHIVKQINNLGHSQIPYMCFGVYGRGGKDELDWEDENYSKRGAPEADTIDEEAEEETPPLSEWIGEDIITTQCTNIDAVIEWIFVPYVIEDDDENDAAEKDKVEGKDEL